MLAVHGIGKQAHTLIQGQSEHAKAHGEKLLREVVYAGYHKVELAKEDPNRKRVRCEDIMTVPLSASPDQTTRFFEVQPDPTSSWRAGIDLSCEDIELDKHIVENCSKELNSMDLIVQDHHGCKQLVTRNALKEGQRIGNISCLVFSTKTLMRDFLNKGGNLALIDSPLLEVGNLETNDPVDGGVLRKSVFCIPVGAARLLTDHRQAKVKFPNVEIICFPELGANDGFLQLRVKTHNQCGISADKALVVDFGPDWQLSTAGTSDAAKRFKAESDIVNGCFMVDARNIT